MGCSSSRPKLPISDSKAAAAAAFAGPLPSGHPLYATFADMLDLEFGCRSETGAVASWKMLEIDCRPDASIEISDFVDRVVMAVLLNRVSVAGLREQWGCAEVGCVGLEQVKLCSATKPCSSEDDNEELDLNEGFFDEGFSDEEEEEPLCHDEQPFGDGRYHSQPPLAVS